MSSSILKVIPPNFDTIDGFLEFETTSRKTLLTLLDQEELELKQFTDEGDIDEEISTFALSHFFAVTVTKGDSFFKGHVVTPASENVDELYLHLHGIRTVTTKSGEWYVGKNLKRINDVDVEVPEYVAVRSTAVKHVPYTLDAYIDSSLAWLFALLMEDYETLYSQFSETDDGE